MTFDELTFGGPYRIAQIRYVTDTGGYHRECRQPGDDITDLPKDAQAKIEAEWIPETLAAYVEAIKEVPVEPDTPPPPTPSDVKIAALEARLSKVEESVKLPQATKTRGEI